MEFGFQKPAAQKSPSLTIPSNLTTGPGQGANIVNEREMMEKLSAEVGFQHPSEAKAKDVQKPRKRGRPRKSVQSPGSASKPNKKPVYRQMPFVDGAPADMRTADDQNCCMTIHGPERVRDEFEAIKATFGGRPSWAVLLVLCRNYVDKLPK